MIKEKKIAFLKAGNALKDYQVISESSDQYHHHLNQMLNCLDATYTKYFFSFGINADYLRDAKLCFEVIPNRGKNKIFAQIHRVLGSARLFLLLCQRQPGIILSNAANEYILPAYLYKLIFTCHLISSNHGEINNKSNLFFRSINLFVLNRVDALIAHGPYLKMSLSKKLKRCQRVKIHSYEIPCLDLAEFSKNLPPLFKKDNNKRVLCFIGRLEQNKGVLDVFQAALPILKQNSEIILVYAGTGSCEGLLRNKITEKGMNNQVKLLGRIDRVMIASLLLSVDISIAATHKSLAEGRCQSVLEALSMGVPVVAPNYGAFEYTFENGYNGLHYEADNVDSLFHSILEVLKDLDGYKERAINRSEDFIKPAHMTYSEAIVTCIPQ